MPPLERNPLHLLQSQYWILLEIEDLVNPIPCDGGRVFSQYLITSSCKLEGKPPSRNESNSGQLNNFKVIRDGRRVCIPLGNDFNFSHSQNSIYVKFRAHNPPSGKETKLGHSSITKLVREVRSWRDPSNVDKDSRFSQLCMPRALSFGNNSSGKDRSELGPPHTFKFSSDG